MDLLLTIISGVTVLLFMIGIVVMSEVQLVLERREYKRYINNTLSFGNRR